MNSSQSKTTSVSLFFFKYQYLIAQIQIIFDNSSNSSHQISSLFSKIIFLALSSASSNNLSNFIILHFLVLIAQSFKDMNPLAA
jgi:hypothetical protein